jgi:hypothetical protein
MGRCIDADTAAQVNEATKTDSAGVNIGLRTARLLQRQALVAATVLMEIIGALGWLLRERQGVMTMG